jgi:2-aminoadipate transaminase
VATDLISFARGAPSADLLPAGAARAAAERALTDDWERALSYGKGRGHPGLCEWIADQHGIAPEHVMVTNGSLEAGAMLFEHVLGPGERVIVEQPSYDRTLLLLERLGAERVGVPLEDDGVDVDALASALDSGPSAKLVHLIPNFHNPAGCTLSDEKRRRVVELAASRGVAIFEDDPYGEIGFEGERLTTLLELDHAGKVIHASSFSKTVSPGVRVGYLAGPEDEIKALAKRANETYISPNMLAESIVWELCRSGALDENIKTVNAALKERRDVLVGALREHIPEAEFVVPGGGYFLWLTLGDDVDCTDLLAAAQEEKVTFVPGADFMLDGGENALRLSFAPVLADLIPEGVERIARALERVRTAAPA